MFTSSPTLNLILLLGFLALIGGGMWGIAKTVQAGYLKMPRLSNGKASSAYLRYGLLAGGWLMLWILIALLLTPLFAAMSWGVFLSLFLGVPFIGALLLWAGKPGKYLAVVAGIILLIAVVRSPGTWIGVERSFHETSTILRTPSECPTLVEPVGAERDWATFTPPHVDLTVPHGTWTPVVRVRNVPFNIEFDLSFGLCYGIIRADRSIDVVAFRPDRPPPRPGAAIGIAFSSPHYNGLPIRLKN